MGRDPFAGVPRQWIEGVIARQGDDFSVELFERDADGNTLGTRSLRATTENCHDLDEAIVLALALIIDPTTPLHPANAANPPTRAPGDPPAGPLEGTPPQLPSTPSPPPAPPSGDRLAQREESPNSNSATSTKARDRDATKPKSAKTDALPVLVTADGVLIYGALPGIAPAVNLNTWIPLEGWPSLTLRLGALYLPEKRLAAPAGTFSFGLTALEAGLCSTHAEGRIRLAACGALGLGAVHAVVHSPVPFEPGDRLWATLGLDAFVAVHLAGPLWLDARLIGLIAPHRWDFRVYQADGPGARAFLQSYVMPGAGVGLSLAF